MTYFIIIAALITIGIIATIRSADKPHDPCEWCGGEVTDGGGYNHFSCDDCGRHPRDCKCRGCRDSEIDAGHVTGSIVKINQ